MSLDSKKGLFLLGIIAGLSAMVLAIGGNPKNMAMCIACFIRDSRNYTRCFPSITI